MVCGGCADDCAIAEVGEGWHGEPSDDVMCFGFVADGQTDFIRAILCLGGAQDGEFYASHN